MRYFTPERLEYFKKAYRELKKYKKLTILSAVFSVMASVFEGFSLGTIIPFFQKIIDPGAENSIEIPFLGNLGANFFGGKQEDVVLKLIIFAFLMIALKSIFVYLKTITISRVGALVRRDLQEEMFFAATEADLKFINKVKSGNLISNISTFTTSMVGFYFTLLDMIFKFSRMVVYLILLIFISWKFTLIAILIEVAIVPMVKKVFSKIKKVSLQSTAESVELHSQMVEKLGNVKLIRMFTAEKYEKENFHKISTSLASLDYRYNRLEAIIGPISEISVLVAIIFIFIFVIKVWGLNVSFYMPLLIAYMYIFLKVYTEINSILKSTARLFQYLEPYKAYENILREANQSKTTSGAKIITSLKEKIVFSNVSLDYGEKNNALEKINLVIPKGKMIALVGPTGSGKTTMANLLAGLIKPTEGQIFVDGEDISNLDIIRWRGIIGYISQDVVIFNDTVANNITYGHFGASEEEIRMAAKTAQIDEFIESLPEKYQTSLGEKGARLSGGQRQRIAIARAVIRKPEILILDEATSALDTETEKAIQESLDSALKGKTVIAIAHRLSTVKRADKIVVILEGQIVEQGSHEQLLRMGKFYKKYYEQQFEN